MQKIIALLLAALLVTSCAPADIEPTATPTVETVFSTPTLPPTATVPATATVPPPTLTPTFAPLPVSVNAQVNIRALPDAGSEVLDIVLLGSQLTGIGRNADSSWLAVQTPKDAEVIGWVSVEFVTVSRDMIAALPEFAAVIPTPIGQAAPPPSGPIKATGTVRNEILVRSGPGQIYADIGKIPAGTVVTVTGRNETDIWLQVGYEQSPTGFGWIAASYVDGLTLTGLPYFDPQGNLIPGQSGVLPTTIPSTLGQATPTGSTPSDYQPAVADADSREKPSVSVVFSPTGDKKFQFQSQVSSPNGDNEDWFLFTPYSPGNTGTYVYMRLDCTGNGAISSAIFLDNGQTSSDLGLHCGNYGFAVKVIGGKQYAVKLVADGSAGEVRLVDYIFYVSMEP